MPCFGDILRELVEYARHFRVLRANRRADAVHDDIC